MKQNPNRTKFKKYHRVQSSVFSLLEQKTFMPTKGFYGLKALESGKLKFIHIEAARRTIRRVTKKNGEMFINVFTNFSVTRKSLGSRMGRGKGLHSFWICPVKKGQILYELNCLSDIMAFKALYSASSKLTVKTLIVKQIY